MIVRTYRTENEEETVELGRMLARDFVRPVLVLLIGNLGAGKTTLTKGIVHGLGVAEPQDVSSPTFPLVHEYGGGVYHVDLYRLETSEQVASLGLDDLTNEKNSIVLIEWGERFQELLCLPHVEIRIDADEDNRIITVTGLAADSESADAN